MDFVYNILQRFIGKTWTYNNLNVVINLHTIGNNRRIPSIPITNHQQCTNYGQGNDKQRIWCCIRSVEWCKFVFTLSWFGRKLFFVSSNNHFFECELANETSIKFLNNWKLLNAQSYYEFCNWLTSYLDKSFFCLIYLVYNLQIISYLFCMLSFSQNL